MTIKEYMLLKEGAGTKDDSEEINKNLEKEDKIKKGKRAWNKYLKGNIERVKARLSKKKYPDVSDEELRDLAKRIENRKIESLPYEENAGVIWRDILEAIRKEGSPEFKDYAKLDADMILGRINNLVLSVEEKKGVLKSIINQLNKRSKDPRVQRLLNGLEKVLTGKKPFKFRGKK
jgi:hypothetical protein